MDKSNSYALPAEFYLQPTIDVAKGLLGQTLKHTQDGKTLYYKIVETEAYLGLSDPAAHSFHGKKTNRTQHMYASAGSLYVYLIYGIHLCLNIVTQDESIPEAVLIRALEPLSDMSLKTNGPGLLGKALNLRLDYNGLKVYAPNSPIQILQSESTPHKILTSARIGISHPIAKNWALRYYLADNQFVSKGPLGSSLA